jgi:outer membrane protein OmpA-like peptidoglycan-associated protein
VVKGSGRQGNAGGRGGAAGLRPATCQFNRILETRDTSRGLIITMADVLFDTGKYEIRPSTREQLAKLSGILLAHPGLNLEVEGHTDSTGSDEFNQRLSEHRASTVRDYLVGQGLASDSVSAAGFGKDVPVANNDTPSGRQRNRRVAAGSLRRGYSAAIGKCQTIASGCPRLAPPGVILLDKLLNKNHNVIVIMLGEFGTYCPPLPYDWATTPTALLSGRRSRALRSAPLLHRCAIHNAGSSGDERSSSNMDGRCHLNGAAELSEWSV